MPEEHGIAVAEGARLPPEPVGTTAHQCRGARLDLRTPFTPCICQHPHLQGAYALAWPQGHATHSQHSVVSAPLSAEACIQLTGGACQVLGTVQFRAPRIPVVSNVTGAPFGAAGGIPALLARQLVEPVQWERTLAGLVAQGKDRLFELGPGAQIRAMLKRISLDAWKACQCVSV